MLRIGEEHVSGNFMKAELPRCKCPLSIAEIGFESHQGFRHSGRMRKLLAVQLDLRSSQRRRLR